VGEIQRVARHLKDIQVLIQDQDHSDFTKVLVIGWMFWDKKIDFKRYIQYCGVLYSHFLEKAESEHDKRVFRKDVEFFRKIRDSGYDKQIIYDYYRAIDNKKLVPF
jgi:hypothetical protein